MHIGNKYSFIETININNKNFINLLDDNGIEIYNKVLNVVNNELESIDNIEILTKEESDILKIYFKYGSLEEVSIRCNIKLVTLYSRIRRILQKLINYINCMVSLKIYNEGKTNSNVPIEVLGLAKISYNSLKRMGINTINDLINYSLEDLIKRKLFGSVNLKSIVDKVHSLGYVFKDDYILNDYNPTLYSRKK